MNRNSFKKQITKQKRVFLFYYFLGIIRFGIIKGSKSSVYAVIRDGDDLALPRKGKRLSSVWLESYIAGNIYQWKKVDFPSDISIPPIQTGTTIYLLIDAINQEIKQRQYKNTGFNYDLHPGKDFLICCLY